MKWTKLGLIFDPTQHKLGDNCAEYAQSPQALVFQDFVRIYFSTREKDKTGKYLSHIAFVDMEKDFRKIINVSRHTVIALGAMGCFDEHGIFPLNVVRAGEKILGYIGGWNRRVSVSVDGAIGLAVSEDQGLTFERLGNGPILASSLHEPFLIGDPFVAIYGNVYYMWYIYGLRWIHDPVGNAKERVYKIGYATSPNGLLWQKKGRPIISDVLGADECQALPTVVKISERYHMFFCYRHVTGFRKERTKGYRFGYAWSQDLEHWHRDDSRSGIELSETGWDSDMMCYPHAFQCEGKTYLLYNGNEFGRFGFGIAILDDAKG